MVRPDYLCSGDATGGHLDGIARFIDANRVFVGNGWVILVGFGNPATGNAAKAKLEEGCRDPPRRAIFAWRGFLEGKP